MVKEISVSNGQPVTLFPLIFIVIVSMIKDLAEDWKRKRSDNEENSKSVKVVKDGRLKSVKWESLRVGDVIKVTRFSSSAYEIRLKINNFSLAMSS